MSRYRCPACGYEYDEERGHPDSAQPDDGDGLAGVDLRGKEGDFAVMGGGHLRDAILQGMVHEPGAWLLAEADTG